MRKIRFSKTHTISSVGVLTAQLFIGIFLFLPIQVRADTADWYDTDWGYRRAIMVDNGLNPEALTDYQIEVTLSSANADFDMYKASAKRAAGIPGWEKHPKFSSLRDYSAVAAAKMPPVDTSYNL